MSVWGNVLRFFGLGAELQAAQPRVTQSVRYYVMPKIGTGIPPVATDPPPTEFVEYAIRPKYDDDIQAIAPTNWERKIDDPLDPSTSLRGSIAIYMLRDPDPAVLAFLNAQPDVIDLGGSAIQARNKVFALAPTNPKMEALRARFPRDVDLDHLFSFRDTRIGRIIGTDTTDFTDSDTTGWDALTNNPLTKVFYAGSDKVTFDVLSNEGRAFHDGTGSVFASDTVHHQTTDSAQNQTVQYKWISGVDSNNTSGVAGRVVDGDTDTFFHGRQIDQPGSDTRLFEVVDGVSNQLTTSADGNISLPKQLRLVIATNGSNTDIDFDIWADSGSPPATPQIQFSGAVNSSLQGKSGAGGIQMHCFRGTNQRVDDLQFTNDDPPAWGQTILIA